MNMDKFTQRGADGAVDVAESAKAYAKALTEWAAQNETPTDTIEAAVEAVFDRFDGRIAMPALVGLALQELKATPDQHKTLSTRVRAYIKGQNAENTGRLDIMKGVGGGVARLALPGQPVPADRGRKSA
jgi:hypothetical protein